jgi:hypothetical protein
VSGEVEVRVRRRCEECTNGVVEHPLWTEYRADTLQQAEEAEARKVGQQEENGVYLEWWRDHGCYMPKGNDVLAVGQGFPAIPPEEVECPTCEGSTWVQSWMPVAELLKPVKDGLAMLDSAMLGL